MRTIGHPAHVFDYDRLPNHTIRIRESKNGEQITTLDGKSYTLSGGDIIADDGNGTIVDLLGIMGLKNSVVADDTKRIVLFIDNNDEHRMRKTSMLHGIRTDAVQMNEKGIDPELAMDALLYGISLYEKYAEGKVASQIINIYPRPYKNKIVSVTKVKIERIMGIPITLEKSAAILERLGFTTTISNNQIDAIVPSYRALDIDIPEDLVEEIARVYGYHNLPSILPPVTSTETTPFADNPFYWEQRVKNALKYWGYTEVYTYPMVSEDMYEGPLDEAVKLANPLGEEFVYMRKTLVPNLLKVMQDNKHTDTIKIFEIANVYEKNPKDLPKEIRMFAGLIKDKRVNFFIVKGLLEQLASDLGIHTLVFKSVEHAGLETEVYLGKELIGSIEILDNDLINFELHFEKLISHATLRRTYIPSNKYPPIIEDLAMIVDDSILTGDIITQIHSTDPLVKEVTLLDKYNDARTFHIIYQHPERNLTSDDVTKIRKDIINQLQKKFSAKIK
jgi:phenylalanyl-tRNA synthetase beta chain